MAARLTSSLLGAYTYTLTHPKRVFLFLFGLFALLFIGANALIPKQEAHAIIPVIIGAAALIIGAGAVGSWALDEAGDTIGDMLRNAANSMFAMSDTTLSSLGSYDALTRNFDQIFEGIEPFIYNVHQTAAIPIANTVLLIFLVVGLVKAVSHMGRSETGIDFMQLLLVFVVFAFLKSIIDASYSWMVLAFDIVRSLISSTFAVAGDFSAATASTGMIGDNVENWGALLVAFLVAFLTWIIAVVVSFISSIVITVRGVQIYVYTAFASIPLAFFVSESSRSVATGFLKRYLAVLFSGAIMALLFCLMGLAVTSGTAVNLDTTESHDFVAGLSNILVSTGGYIAFAWCLFKSGAWAKEFVGV